MEAQPEIRTRTAVVCLEGDLIRVTIVPGAEETLADAQATTRAALGLSAGRILPLFVDMRQMRAQEREARQYYGSMEVMRSVCGVALLVESRLSMLIANFFISVSKTRVPTRIFTSEAEAVEWLKGIRA